MIKINRKERVDDKSRLSLIYSLQVNCQENQSEWSEIEI